MVSGLLQPVPESSARRQDSSYYATFEAASVQPSGRQHRQHPKLHIPLQLIILSEHPLNPHVVPQPRPGCRKAPRVALREPGIGLHKYRTVESKQRLRVLLVVVAHQRGAGAARQGSCRPASMRSSAFFTSFCWPCKFQGEFGRRFWSIAWSVAG